MTLLSVNGISKQESGNFTIRDIHFEQQTFQKIAIAGETGSGKTTLLRIIAGLLQPHTGTVFFEKEKVLGPLEKLIPGHSGIAYLSQHFELRNNYRVEEELESKNLLTDEEARRIYTVCRIEHLLKRKTDQLSGGERQRIVLARLLTTSPRLLLLDEPFSNLDAVHKRIIKSVLYDIGEQLEITCILVSHDGADVLSWADEILVMKEGQIIQRGAPQHIYNQPVNEYCAGLFGEYNLIAIDSDSAFATIQGIQLNGKQLLIRPESFHITKEEKSVFTGIVKDILYRGSYYIMDVLVGKKLFRIQTNNSNLVIGDTIHLFLSVADISYV
jgi:ABC-type Fe3+/spermidine/putrescine transport system ATPase subunit